MICILEPAFSVYELDMSQLWQWLWQRITVALLVLCLADLSTAQGDTKGCEYMYLIQPPSEIPCKPYDTGRNASSSLLYLSMECIVTLPKADNHKSTMLNWTKKCGDKENHLQSTGVPMPYSGDENFILLRSVLRREGEPAFQGVCKYWCELSSQDPPGNTTLNFTITNVATVNPPEYYSSLPPCHHDTVFHLAEASCAETGQSLSSSLPSPSPLVPSHCSSDESSGPMSLTTMVMTIVAISIGVPVILVTMLLIAALTILLVRKKRRKGGKKEHAKEDNSTSRAEESARDRGETPTSPAVSAVVNQSPKVAMSPPTQQQVTAREQERRAAAQVSKPKIPPRHKKEDTGEKNGLRKELYRKLDLKTMENTHIYTTTAGNSSDEDHMEQNGSAKNPPIITLSNSYSYVTPDDICSTQDQGMYQGLQSSTQDYLALYVTPSAQGTANSSMSQPVYAEPSSD